jgi:hypothetical protein
MEVAAGCLQQLGWLPSGCCNGCTSFCGSGCTFKSLNMEVWRLSLWCDSQVHQDTRSDLCWPNTGCSSAAAHGDRVQLPLSIASPYQVYIILLQS